MIFGLTGNYRKTEYLEIVAILVEALRDLGHRCILSDDVMTLKSLQLPQKLKFLPVEKLAQESDIILSIGGDGTILSTARRISEYVKPILGIHIGGLGFLAESTRATMLQAIQYIHEGDFKVEDRMMLELKFGSSNGSGEVYQALNDIVIDHGHSGRVLKTEIMVSGNYLNTYESDGIIFSTPTGSTAYSLSAGGPIITPTIDTITVTPICPHSLSARPIILPASEIISASFAEEYEGIACTVDGQIRLAMKDTTQLELSKSTKTIPLISLPGNNYFMTLRTKMGWTGNIR